MQPPIIEEKEYTVIVTREPLGPSGVAGVGYGCRWCGLRHLHGWPNADERETTRVSHCHHEDAPKYLRLVLSERDEDTGQRDEATMRSC